MILVVITARPSYARVKTVLEHLPSAKVLAAASALLPRYGRIVDQIRQDGFEVVSEVYSVVEGSAQETSVLSTGLLTSQLASAFSLLKPRLIVTIADRHETLATAIAATYLNIPLAHIQGGEISGNIDDRVRRAITQMADLHFPATHQAYRRVVKQRGSSDGVTLTGCPSVDLAARHAKDLAVQMNELGGIGHDFDLSRPFLLIMHHASTELTSFQNSQVMQAILEVCWSVPLPILGIWPGEDAGADAIVKVWRQLREGYPDRPIHLVRHVNPIRFYRLLTQTSCLIGNSSVGIRECGYLGTPVIDVGLRQIGRECAQHVLHVWPRAWDIREAIGKQLIRGYRRRSVLYGNGKAGEQIAQVLKDYCSRATEHRHGPSDLHHP